MSLVKHHELEATTDGLAYFVPAHGENALGEDPLGTALRELGGTRALKELEFADLQPGEAVLKRAYGTKVAFIVATPSPVYNASTHEGVDAFSAALRCCLSAANERGLASICFGSWSLAAAGMPARLAAMTTYRVLDEWQRMNRRRHLKRIVLALHDREGFKVFREVARLPPSSSSAQSSLLALPNILGEDGVWKVDKVSW